MSTRAASRRSDAELVAQAVRRFSRLKAPLVLDLSHLDFLSSAGFRELLILDEHRLAGPYCSVVGGPALVRSRRWFRISAYPLRIRFQTPCSTWNTPPGLAANSSPGRHDRKSRNAQRWRAAVLPDAVR